MNAKKTVVTAVVVLVLGYVGFQVYIDREFAKAINGEDYNEWLLEKVVEERLERLQGQADRRAEKQAEQDEPSTNDLNSEDIFSTEDVELFPTANREYTPPPLDPPRFAPAEPSTWEPPADPHPALEKPLFQQQPAPQQPVQPQITGPLAPYDTVTQVCIDKYMDTLDYYREKYQDARFYPQDWESDGYNARMTGRVDVFGAMAADSATLLCELSTSYSDPTYDDIYSQFSYF